MISFHLFLHHPSGQHDSDRPRKCRDDFQNWRCRNRSRWMSEFPISITMAVSVFLPQNHPFVFICFPLLAGGVAVTEALDSIQLTLFGHRFMSIAEQMGRTLQVSDFLPPRFLSWIFGSSCGDLGPLSFPFMIFLFLALPFCVSLCHSGRRSARTSRNAWISAARSSALTEVWWRTLLMCRFIWERCRKL